MSQYFNDKSGFFWFIKLFFCFFIIFSFDAACFAENPSAVSLINDSSFKKLDTEKEIVAKEYLRDYFYKRGRQFLKEKRYEDAALDFNKALEYDSEYGPALKYLDFCKKKLHISDNITDTPAAAQSFDINLPSELNNYKMDILPVVEPYRIGPEDVLNISVWKHPDLTQEVIVPPDGKITFPLLGEIQAGGSTITELKDKISQGLKDYAKKRFTKGEDGEKGDYLIGFGDELSVLVWRVPDLSGQLIVRPDGKISVPLIGDLKAEGLTLNQLDTNITEALKEYVKDPQVSIMIRSFGAEEVFVRDDPQVTVYVKDFGKRKVVVLGDVNMPGVYSFTGDIRLSEAVGLARGTTQYAHRDKIMVIRGDLNNNPKIIKVNLIKIYKGDVKQDILINHGDVVYVPKTTMGNVKELLDILRQSVETAYSGRSFQLLTESNP